MDAKRYAMDVIWDVSLEDALKQAEEMGTEDLATVLNFPELKFMTKSEIDRALYDRLRSSLADRMVLVDLPEAVRLPRGLDDEDVHDWLSDEYGYCVRSFRVVRLTKDGEQ